jgi:hypothetical protein
MHGSLLTEVIARGRKLDFDQQKLRGEGWADTKRERDAPIFRRLGVNPDGVEAQQNRLRSVDACGRGRGMRRDADGTGQRFRLVDMVVGYYGQR